MTPTPDPLRAALRDMVAHDADARDCCGDWGTDPCPHRTRAEAALARPVPALDVDRLARAMTGLVFMDTARNQRLRASIAREYSPGGDPA